jgi:DNA-binding response OmpR family regulator
VGKKILVVDDDPMVLGQLESALEASGYEVRTCDSGRRVLPAMESFHPDLVVLDIMLPGVDGFTLRHHMSLADATKNVPVIILTGLEPSRTLFHGVPQVACFLTKPFKTEDLVQEVNRVLAGRAA